MCTTGQERGTEASFHLMLQPTLGSCSGAGVRPTRAAGRVTRAECDRIAAALVRVLERSIETGGSSISDYLAPDGSDGAYQDERRVYAREGEPCHECGAKIRRIVLGQRSAHYCPACQS